MRFVRFQASATVWSGTARYFVITLRGLVFGVFLDLDLESGFDRLPRNVGNQLPSYSDKHYGKMKAVREFDGRLIQCVF